MSRALVRALDDLSEADRSVIVLREVQGLPYDEIASTLGISIKTVESQMGKALRHLRLRLAGWLPNGDTL